MQSVDVQSYEETIGTIYRAVGGAIGVHVMMMVVERSIWLMRSSHPEVALVTFDEEGISLRALSEAHPDEAGRVASSLILGIVATLGRLVGKQVAQQLTEQLEHFRQEA